MILGSPAAAAGLRSGDQFVSIGGEPIRDHGDVVLGLLDMVSDEGSTDIDVRGRDGQVRHLRAERSGFGPAPEADRAAGAVSWSWLRFLEAAVSRAPRCKCSRAALRRSPVCKPAISSWRRTARTIRNFKELAEYINARPGETVTLAVRRGEQRSDDSRERRRAKRIGDRTIGRIRIEADQSSRACLSERAHASVTLGPLEALGMSVESRLGAHGRAGEVLRAHAHRRRLHQESVGRGLHRRVRG